MAKSGFKPKFSRCSVCGKPYEQRSAQQIRCAECQKKYVAQRVKERKDERLKRTDYQAWLIKHDETTCRKVKKCKYGLLCGGIWICDYLDVEGHRRPCSVKDCDEFKRRK